MICIESAYKVAPNIALIKYWGKFDQDLILPLNSSLSLTLDCDDLCTETKVTFTNSILKDSFILNNQPTVLGKRISNILNFFRSKCKKIESLVDEQNMNSMFFHIESVNNFPTASGLASSSSGFACLTYCLRDIFQFKEEYQNQLTEIARLGSGSASRSLYGGVVEWIGINQLTIFKQNNQIKSQDLNQQQKQELSQKCVAQQVFEASHVEDLQILILCANFDQKEVPSTDGMQQSVETSQFLNFRVNHIVEQQMIKIKSALQKKDFNMMCDIIMQDSNNFHSVCLDTQPPIFYLNNFSKFIISIVNQMNQIFNKKLSYTFDAGPHAVLIMPNEIFQDVFKFFVKLFELNEKNQILNQNSQNFYVNLQSLEFQNNSLEDLLIKYKNLENPLPSYIIKTKVYLIKSLIIFNNFISKQVGKGPQCTSQQK